MSMLSQSHTCQNCKKPFTIEPEDFVFYEKMKVPPPTWCPPCRLMRRLIWRNERTLYARTCDMCHNSIIAMYPADTVFPVYCRECWFSDKWDAADYGRTYDFSKPFFSQFHELLNAVPQLALQAITSPDSKYVNLVANCTGCYLIADGIDNEGCQYSTRIFNSRDTIDSGFVRHVEQCYECMNSDTLSCSSFSDDCSDSFNLNFCSDVRGSSNCFMSASARMKSYLFRNEELTESEYLARLKDIDTGSYGQLEKYRQEYDILRSSRLQKYMSEKNTTDCTGHGIVNSHNCKHCFYCSNIESCKYLFKVSDLKDCYDLNSSCCSMERGYELSSTGLNVYNVMLSADMWPDVRDSIYSQSCRNDINDVFGCVSLRKKQYCILNKRYSADEYFELKEKIIAHMNEVPYRDARGRSYLFGEFFPPEISLFAYNESAAQDYMPKTKEEADNFGFPWKNQEKKIASAATISSANLPDHIGAMDDSLSLEVIECLHQGSCNHQCPGLYKINARELRFYRERNIALPRLCMNCRHYERMAHTQPYQLWERLCQCTGDKSSDGRRTNNALHTHGRAPCKGIFQTSFSPDRPEIIYCEECYKAEMV